MNTETCQNLIIGTGESGKQLAWTLASQGQKTISIERAVVGGSCPNVACLPSKNVIYTAKAASLVRRAPEFGFTTGSLKIDMAGVIRRKAAMVNMEDEFHLNRFKSTGVELVFGHARFIEPKTVRISLKDGGERTIRGERVFINVGSRASIPTVPGLADARPMTHVEALNLQRLPEHLVILGGGYVGLEFAQAMRRLGSRVTIIQHGLQLLPHEDPDVAEAVSEMMTAEGAAVLLKTELQYVAGKSGDRVQLQINTGSNTSTIDATDILVATGRTPNTDSLSCDKAGVDLDYNGFVRVNDTLQTSAPETWAMGDCAGSPFFTHVAFDDYRIVRDNLAGKLHSKSGRLIPSCLFTDPELAHIGLTETAAKAQNIGYRLAKMPAANILRTHTTSETRGFLKVLIGDDDRILGFTAFCADASEPLAAVQTAMLARAPFTLLRDAIYPHPTFAEGLNGLFAAVSTTATSAT
jgi:pyruvate/2-oxoglutarate dehydrogenase complex dihydrolipoamide dehydrogenase (E3) component